MSRSTSPKPKAKAQSAGSLGPSRPADECPWPRPFSEGFDRCPTYLEQHFLPLETGDQPLTPVRTCRHLVSRSLNGRSGWYGACEIGDTAARQRRAGAPWRKELAYLRQKMQTKIRPFVEGLWTLKARQLQAAQRGEPDKLAFTPLNRAATVFIAETRTFLALHQNEFQRLGLSTDLVMTRVKHSLDRFIERDHAETRWEVPTNVLDLPEQTPLAVRPL